MPTVEWSVVGDFTSWEPAPTTGSCKQQFLIRMTGAKARAHLWLGNDTACRMWSTGGIKQSRYMVTTERGDHEICQMCLKA